VAVAVSNAGEVGVDVQQVEDGSVQELSPLVLAEAEAGHVAVARDFFTYWTRKEALVKATGDGVTVPLPHVVVSPPGTPPRVLGYPRPDGLAAAGQLVGVEHLLAVQAVQPVGLVDGVEVALAQVGAMATAVRSAASCRSSQSMAPLTTVPVEPPNRKP
jgi:phosphopantetheinyl transferase